MVARTCVRGFRNGTRKLHVLPKTDFKSIVFRILLCPCCFWPVLMIGQSTSPLVDIFGVRDGPRTIPDPWRNPVTSICNR